MLAALHKGAAAQVCGLTSSGVLEWPLRRDGDVVKVQWSDWASSKIVANSTAIVLREKLSQSVELVEATRTSTYMGLASDHGVDLDMELYTGASDKGGREE